MSVESILTALAQNASDAQLRRGAIYGGIVQSAAAVPGAIVDDREKQALLARSQAVEAEKLGFARNADTRAQQDQAAQNTATTLAAQKQGALKAGIAAGFGSSSDPKDFDESKAIKAVTDAGFPDLAPVISETHRNLLPKLTSGAAGSVMRDEAGHTVPGSEIADKPNETEVALKAAGGDPAKAMALLKPKPTGSTTEADDQRYRGIQAAMQQKQPITPEDAAWAFGYEKQKTLGVDKSAGAAADRQTNAIAAQTSQQGRAQAFETLKTARADIQKNADTPYQTAHASANTLRDVVDAAKAGNDVAGSLQSLETTMAAIRAQGLNRVNATEIGSTANAGSLFENVSAWLGKQEKGKAAAVPPKVQQDMQDFADILDKAAAKKYNETHTGINKLYGTSIPPTFQTGDTGGVKILSIVPKQD